jgi:hypothetical protein
VDKSVALDELDVRVVSDLLDHGLIEVAGVALESITNVKGVLQAREGLV